MDASVKQRLIGAAVLVALAVIFLPMLIGGPDQASDEARVPTGIPARGEHDLVTRHLVLASEAPAASATTTEIDDPDRVATVDMTDAPARVDALSGESLNGTPRTAATAESAAPVPVVPVPAPAPRAAPVAASPAVPVASVGPASGVASEPAAHPLSDTSGRWAVNLGSYANAANATALVEQLRQQKLPAYAEAISLGGKPVQRVRLGPFAQRAEAESARLSALRIRNDLPSGVVSLEGEETRVAVKPAVAEGFALQIGALSSEADANALRDRARAAGFASYVERVGTSTGTLWRVRIGPELQRANAERLKGEVKGKLGLDGNVVPHP